MDVEVNLKGVPPGQIKVLEAGLKTCRREHKEMTIERETQLRRLADETKAQLQRACERRRRLHVHFLSVNRIFCKVLLSQIRVPNWLQTPASCNPPCFYLG
jgi:hypothetical protein